MKKGAIIISLAIAGLLTFSGTFENEAMYGRIHADAQGYYGYLVASVLEGTFDWEKVIGSYSDTYFNGAAADFTVESDHGRINKYYAGTALLMLPFFLLSCLAAVLFGFPVDGYSEPFQVGVVIGALFYAGVGMYLLLRLLEAKNIDFWIAIVASVLCLFGTQLFHYSVSEPSMSHAYSFGLFGAFLFLTNRWVSVGGNRTFFLLSAVFALIVLVRPVNGLIILSTPFAAGGLEPLFERIKEQFTFGKLATALILSGGIFGIQFVAYYLQVGKPIVWSYHGEGFNFSSPEAFNFLFSFKKGLFVYTPISLIGLFGILFWSYKKPREGVWLLLLLGVAIYALSSWWNWYYGGSLGMRAMIEFMPFFTIGLAYLLQHTSTIYRGVILSLCLVFVTINLVQSYQYQHFILHWDNMDENRYWQVFMKTDRSYDGIFYRQSEEEKPELVILDKQTFYSDLEDQASDWGIQGVTDERAFSGSQSTKVNNKVPFGATLGVPVTQLGIEGKKVVQVSAMVWAEDAYPEFVIAYSYRGPEGDYGHSFFGLGHAVSEAEKWTKVELEVDLTEAQDTSHLWVIYPHNSTSIDVFLDDLRYEVVTYE